MQMGAYYENKQVNQVNLQMGQIHRKVGMRLYIYIYIYINI